MIILFSIEKVNTITYNKRKTIENFKCFVYNKNKRVDEMSKYGYSIGVDLGGTNTAVGLVRLDTKEMTRHISIKTNAPRSCESISRDILELSEKLCRQEGISLSELLWIGVAAPGTVKDGVVYESFNLSWENVEFGKILSDITKRPTYVANDANAVAYAEAICGSGVGAKSLVALTIGTGVGGGIVFEGKIHEGMNGFAAEIGHTVLVPGGKPCPCGRLGCLEAYCSVTALVKETKRVMKEHPESSMHRLALENRGRVSGKTAFLAMKEGDAAGKAVVDGFISNLALGISNVINILQPDVVCIGGGLSREGDSLMIPLSRLVKDGTFGREGHRTRVVAATFKNDAGIIGAALLGLQGSDGKSCIR